MSTPLLSKSMIIVGAGIAGAALAYQAARAGWQVTVLDAGGAGYERASDVPVALLNPVRGQGGRTSAQSIAGMHHTWALLDELSAQGQTIPYGKTGVLRPIPDQKTYAKWLAHLPAPAELSQRWLDAGQPESEQPASEQPAPQALADLPRGWYKVLYLPQAGWLSGAALTRALLAGAKARGAAVYSGVMYGGVVSQYHAHSVRLITGEDYRADVVVNCTGSSGARRGEGTHRAGSVLLLHGAGVTQPLSFGAYLSPLGLAGTGVLGGTFEAPQDNHAAALRLGLPLASLSWLLQKGAALTDLSRLSITGQWTGVRLSGVPLSLQPDGAGVYHLRGLGSKGFLLGPLLAQQLLDQLG